MISCHFTTMHSVSLIQALLAPVLPSVCVHNNTREWKAGLLLPCIIVNAKRKVKRGRLGTEAKALRVLCEFRTVSNKHASLVPRPHPLMRRNGLVNQVEFLGLAHTFAQCNLATFKIFYVKPAQKRYGYSSRDKYFYHTSNSR